jgi:uncharacterized protein
MAEPDHRGAVAYSLDCLRRELSPKLTYHNLWHTEKDVMPACIRLAQHSGVTDEELSLLETAAAFHDLGFTETRINHEIAGVRIAAQVLPRFSFRPCEIDRIIGMIMATRLPQSPRTRLEEILADADLDVFGRSDFFSRNEDLRQEWFAFGREVDMKSWLEGQLAFLRSHTYFTPAARMLRLAAKEKHIEMLEEKLRYL